MQLCLDLPCPAVTTYSLLSRHPGLSDPASLDVQAVVTESVSGEDASLLRISDSKEIRGQGVLVF